MLCKALFRRGEEEQAFTQVANGAAEGWAPDEALFERMLAAHGARGDAAAAEDTLAAMKALGVVARIAHYNHLVRAVAISRGAVTARSRMDNAFGRAGSLVPHRVSTRAWVAWDVGYAAVNTGAPGAQGGERRWSASTSSPATTRAAGGMC